MGADDRYLIGIDLGTESARAGIFDLEGRAIAAAATIAAQSGSPRPPGNGQKRSGFVAMSRARRWNQIASKAIWSLRYSNVRS